MRSFVPYAQPWPFVVAMKFLDEAKIYIRSGNGGAGCVSFRREKYVALGGPDGGDGGRGGHVWAVCVDGLNTLIDYRYRQHYKAKTGGHGMGRNRSGAAGADSTLLVPVGTQIFDDDSQELIADFTETGQRARLARGGNGGFGNAHFKSATNRAPRHANPGAPGEEKWIRLRLKLIAHAGLVGMPNAGKSTLLSRVSAARPKIADYPFTTLHPNLGVVKVEQDSFVLADIPGLIAGAHTGVGLGSRFLAHVERCHVLLHLVDATSPEAFDNYQVIRKELTAYHRSLAAKPEIIALNKCDAVPTARAERLRDTLASPGGGPVHIVSAATGKGMRSLCYRLFETIKAHQKVQSSIGPAKGDPQQEGVDQNPAPVPVKSWQP